MAIWPPVVTNGSEQVVSRLLDALAEFLQRQSLRLARALLPLQDQRSLERFARIGFEYQTTVASLVWSVSSRLEPAQPSLLDFIPVRDPAQRAVLSAIKQQSYMGSLDCPRIIDAFAATDVLEMYQTAATWDPNGWYVTAVDGVNMGCLILADDERQNQLELVYLGVLPRHRGNGFGRQLVRQAQRIASLRDRQRITVTVDSENRPAVAAYHNAGFEKYAERQLIARVFPD